MHATCGKIARAGADAGRNDLPLRHRRIQAALERAFDAAGGRDVSVGGGAETAQQYLRAQLVDEVGIHVSPLLLGSGSRLFDHLDGGPVGFELVSLVSSPAAAHFSYVRGGGA